MSVGRIESYIHSDNITPNKGGVLVKVTCSSDFGAKTDEFKAFAAKIAKMAYAFGHGIESDESTTVWESFVLEAAGTGQALEAERQELEKKLREKITVEEIVILTL